MKEHEKAARGDYDSFEWMDKPGIFEEWSQMSRWVPIAIILVVLGVVLRLVL